MTLSMRESLFALLGDEHCDASFAPSVRSLCGKGPFNPPPLLSAALATILISIAPLFFLPFIAEPKPGAVGAAQPLLLCFAAGGMLGDVFLHILPSTFGGGHSHDHGGHGGGGGHEHHHHHGHNDLPYEWAGIFTASGPAHTLKLQAIDGKWAEPAMKIVVLPTSTPNEASLHALEGEAGHGFAATCKDVASGNLIKPTEDACFNLLLEGGLPDVTFPILTDGVKGFAMFTEHMPSEFIAEDSHYLLGPSGMGIEPVATIGEEAGGHAHGGHDHDHGHEHHDHGHAHGHAHGADEHGHSHSLDEAIGGLVVLAGFMAFYVIEKWMRRSGGGHSHGGHSHSHAHDHAAESHDHAHDENGACCEHGHADDDAVHDHGHADAKPTPPSKRRGASPSPAAKRDQGLSRRKGKGKGAAAAAHEHDHEDAHEHSHASSAPAPAPAAVAKVETKEEASNKAAGYLNLVADAAHNFTDGLTLGAAFRVGFPGGVAATMAVLMHEVPHEVGDVAILMQVGFTKWQAIRAQLLTAIGAMIGALVGASTGQTQAGLLLNFTAGGFIYIATVDVLPQLLTDSSMVQTLKEVLAFAVGVGMMLIVMAYE